MPHYLVSSTNSARSGKESAADIGARPISKPETTTRSLTDFMVSISNSVGTN